MKQARTRTSGHQPAPETALYTRVLICTMHRCRSSLAMRRNDNRSLSADDARNQRVRDPIGRRVRITEPMERMRSTSEPSTSVELSRACSSAVQQARGSICIGRETVGRLPCDRASHQEPCHVICQPRLCSCAWGMLLQCSPVTCTCQTPHRRRTGNRAGTPAAPACLALQQLPHGCCTPPLACCVAASIARCAPSYAASRHISPGLQRSNIS